MEQVEKIFICTIDIYNAKLVSVEIEEDTVKYLDTNNKTCYITKIHKTKKKLLKNGFFENLLFMEDGKCSWIVYSPVTYKRLSEHPKYGVKVLKQMKELLDTSYDMLNNDNELLDLCRTPAHYELKPLPTIAVLKRPPTVYQFQNSLWMGELEKNLEPIKYSNVYPFTDDNLGEMYWSPTCGLLKENDVRMGYTLQGGLLLDEAGLGKSMAFVMHAFFNNRTKLEGQDPVMTNGLFKSRATLIVTKNHLVQQFEEEIRDCLNYPSLKIVTISDKRKWGQTTLRDVCDADFVITSYDFLAGTSYRSEFIRGEVLLGLYQTSLDEIVNKTKGLGYTARYPVLHTVHFNRLCFDEIQNLYGSQKNYGDVLSGSDTCNKAIQISLLSGTYRWGLSASAFTKRTDILSVICLLINRPKKYSVEHYRKISMSLPHLIKKHFRFNSKQSISKEIVFKTVTRKISPVTMPNMERRLYNSFSRDNNKLREFCACPKQALQEENGNDSVLMFTDIEEMGKKLYEKYVEELVDQHKRLKELMDQIKSTQDSVIKDYYQGSEELDKGDPYNDYDYINRNIALITKKGKEPAENLELAPWFEDDWKFCKEYLETKKPNITNLLDKDPKGYGHTMGGLKASLRNTLTKINASWRSKLYMEKEVINAVKEKEVTECSVCCEDYSEQNRVHVTKCGHFYCGTCINLIFEQRKQCSVCRIPFNTRADIYVVSEPDKLSERIKKYGSKIAILISLLRNKFADPESGNVIIFSEYDALLTYVGQLLNTDGIKTLFMKGNTHMKNATIRKFKDRTKAEEERYRVLLLSSKRSAEGTNLTIANTIIFIDPIYGTLEERKSVINQAVGRSLRLNQTKDVDVIFLAMRDSIEDAEILRTEGSLEDIKVEITD